MWIPSLVGPNFENIFGLEIFERWQDNLAYLVVPIILSVVSKYHHKNAELVDPIEYRAQKFHETKLFTPEAIHF